MQKNYTLLILSFLFIGTSIAQVQQAGPYSVRASEEYKSPKKHRIGEPLDYGEDGIIQVSSRGCKSLAFQLFSESLKYKSGNVASTENLLNERTNYDRFVRFKNKTYLFVRDVNREASTEGISALEFSPEKLGFVGKSKSLFQSSDKVRTLTAGFGGYGYAVSYRDI